MSIKQLLLVEHSKSQRDKVVQFIGSDEQKFENLLELMLSNEKTIDQRAAWAFRSCTEKYPDWFISRLDILIPNLQQEVHVAVKRNTLAVLKTVVIPEDLLGITADICFNFLENFDEPVAIKAFSMQILCNICLVEPDLSNELILIIEDQLPHGSPGFKSLAKKILKKLRSPKQN